MQEKVQHGLSQGFQIFKLKLINENPLDTISWFLQTTDKPFMVDANQSWTNNAELSGHYINLMFKDAGCLLMEQPFEKENWEKTSLLKTVSEVPIYADESCQRISDLEKVAENFSGVNIKLMKCGGITEAYQMIKKARQLKLKILIGCMSESSVGCTAAAHLSPLTDYADLDGPYLITNDPFDGMKIENGRIKLNVLKEKISLV
jgi:L-alanine-DL-glutamate epimerase-like enolase superfamily enzyme